MENQKLDFYKFLFERILNRFDTTDYVQLFNKLLPFNEILQNLFNNKFFLYKAYSNYIPDLETKILFYNLYLDKYETFPDLGNDFNYFEPFCDFEDGTCDSPIDLHRDYCDTILKHANLNDIKSSPLYKLLNLMDNEKDFFRKNNIIQDSFFEIVNSDDFHYLNTEINVNYNIYIYY